MKKLLITGLCLLAFNLTAQTLKDITLTDASTGKEYALSQLAGSKGLVIIYTGLNCPYDQYYSGRVNELVNTYKSRGVNFILVNANEDEVENVAAIKKFIKDRGYNLSYFLDEDKMLMNSLGVSKSPEAVILQGKGSQLLQYYKGAIDNNPQIAEDVKEKYLQVNLDNLLIGKNASPAEVRPTGCRIK